MDPQAPTSTTGTERSARPVRRAPAGAAVWGLSADEAHKRYWAGARVRVVRPGDTDLERRGPALYMLCPAGDLVLFRLQTIVRRFAWAQAKAVHLRVSDNSSDRYAERVEVDAGGRVRGVSREYSRRVLGSTHVVLTSDRQLAEAWAESSDARGAYRALRRTVGRDAILAMPARGRVLDGRSAADAETFCREITQVWSDLGNAFDGVYHYGGGVWIHESAEIDRAARLVGPLWIGAGARIGEGQIRVGPGVIPDAPEMSVRPNPIDWAEQRPPGWRLMPRLRNRRLRRTSKRLFDIAFSLGAIAATLPVYPVVMLLIWREDGRPWFFAHTRQTVGGRDFPCLKFRTMRRDAEKIKAELTRTNEADGPQFFMRDDPRLLRCGKLLRRLQIDEFPQFFNVLLGHMSIVGPRPSPDKENQFCPAWREARLSIRPGITGLWQVRRTREPQTDFQEWIRYDLEYVQRESWTLDLWIIFRTIRQIVFRG